MAVYLASFNETAIGQPEQDAWPRARKPTGTRTITAPSIGARLYEGACAVCHEVGGAPLFGSRPSLALNSNLHSAVPDNLIQVILHGIASPVSSDLGYMPAFKDSMTDDQVAELASLPAAAIRPGQAAMGRPGGGHRPHQAVGGQADTDIFSRPPAGNGPSCRLLGRIGFSHGSYRYCDPNL